MCMTTLLAFRAHSNTFRLALNSQTPSSAAMTPAVSEEGREATRLGFRGMPTVTSASPVRRQGHRLPSWSVSVTFAVTPISSNTRRNTKAPRLPGTIRMCWPSRTWGAMARATSSWRGDVNRDQLGVLHGVGGVHGHVGHVPDAADLPAQLDGAELLHRFQFSLVAPAVVQRDLESPHGIDGRRGVARGPRPDHRDALDHVDALLTN